ncbi:MAG: c-type cytochrome [Verrucomicrobiota bacterium]
MAQPGPGDGLLRWLLGGLVVGAIVLGLMVGAYEIGYHHGKDHSGRNAAATRPATTTTSAPAPAGGTTAGKELFTADACSGCHTLDGGAGAGPTMAGLAGGTVTLDDGSTVTADDAYLAKAITDPDAQIVKGYAKGVMSGAISSFGLRGKPQDVAALVAFIKAQAAKG